MANLSEETINKKLNTLVKWDRIDGIWIQCEFKFEDYLQGMDFVNKVAIYAEKEEQHHPHITIDYKVVTLKMSSWHSKGLTNQDFRMAEFFDSVYNKTVNID